MRLRTLLSWSSGKDSAFALHVLREAKDMDIVGLFATVNRTFKRVAMHAVREELLQRQADAVKLPLITLEIPHPCSNKAYEAIMKKFVNEAKDQGITRMAFGDLFLQDIRSYREEKLRGSGITPMFPLWGKPSDQLAREMIGLGFRMIITCVDPGFLPRDFVGREFDERFINDLPAGVDPCGENGEFHTFVYDGPIFKSALRVEVGSVVERDGFIFADVISKKK
jgi:uncharacterized protein (TIGR00290 family)